MIILAIRTDKPDAEVGLFNGVKKLDYKVWSAHRELADTIHIQIKKLLDSANKDWADIEAVVVFKGPGSFTGLRIGFTIANTIAYSQKIPIVSCKGKSWLQDGISRLKNNEDEHIALPEYGGKVNITKPKK